MWYGVVRKAVMSCTSAVFSLAGCRDTVPCLTFFDFPKEHVLFDFPRRRACDRQEIICENIFLQNCENNLSAKLFGMERYDTDSARASAQRQPDKLIVISAA
jgi:hypothetical protein